MRKYILFFVLVFVCFIIQTRAQEYHGVFVGINDYPGTINDLSDCVNDAQGIRDGLIYSKYWPSGDCDLLTNTYASETAIMNAIYYLPRRNAYIDAFFFFFFWSW